MLPGFTSLGVGGAWARSCVCACPAASARNPTKDANINRVFAILHLLRKCAVDCLVCGYSHRQRCAGPEMSRYVTPQTGQSTYIQSNPSRGAVCSAPTRPL